MKKIKYFSCLIVLIFFTANYRGELTGDFSQEMALPLVSCPKNNDLKGISIHTMADLVRGAYKDKVNYKIFDCRYPYEYNGGHIKDALNYHHPKMVYDCVNDRKDVPKIPDVEAPREVIIFHCEFSAERGPKAQRLMRNEDRTNNKDHYPALYYPELYLLVGGYKQFYHSYPELCTPESYTTMDNAKYAEEFKLCRSKSKSWAADVKQVKGARTLSGREAKRLGL